MKSDYIIILDAGHGVNTPGKQSPDGKLKEFAYTREIVSKIYQKLTNLGYQAYILVPETIDIPLSTRVRRANQIYTDNGKKAILVSVHCNASSSDGNWHTASGWSVFVAQNASQSSKELANCIKNSASEAGLKVRLQYPDRGYWVQSLAICRDSSCPAVLTENLFQDNKSDIEFLLSESGKNTIADIHVSGITKYLSS